MRVEGTFEKHRTLPGRACSRGEIWLASNLHGPRLERRFIAEGLSWFPGDPSRTAGPGSLLLNNLDCRRWVGINNLMHDYFGPLPVTAHEYGQAFR
jgi:hypothetical protein